MSTIPIQLCYIRFPEINLLTRDAHKLRGYFGNLFREKSELLHNHMGNGQLKYAYPLVQYKVIDGLPMLVGINEGAELLAELFLKIDHLKIDDNILPVHQKNIEMRHLEVGFLEEPAIYSFETLWMALNQKNFDRYNKASLLDKQRILETTLIGNCLSFFKSLDFFVKDRIVVEAMLREKMTNFKNVRMLVFDGAFKTNIYLPDYIGLGKQVSRGFGSIRGVSGGG